MNRDRQAKEFRRGFQIHFVLMGAVVLGFIIVGLIMIL